MSACMCLVDARCLRARESERARVRGKVGERVRLIEEEIDRESARERERDRDLKRNDTIVWVSE